MILLTSARDGNARPCFSQTLSFERLEDRELTLLERVGTELEQFLSADVERCREHLDADGLRLDERQRLGRGDWEEDENLALHGSSVSNIRWTDDLESRPRSAGTTGLANGC